MDAVKVAYMFPVWYLLHGKIVIALKMNTKAIDLYNKLVNVTYEYKATKQLMVQRMITLNSLS